MSRRRRREVHPVTREICGDHLDAVTYLARQMRLPRRRVLALIVDSFVADYGDEIPNIRLGLVAEQGRGA